MTLRVLGVSGKAGTGKDWSVVQHWRPRGFCPWSLAWHLKVWAVGQGLFTYEEVFLTKPPQVRRRLQQIGTEEGRMVYGESVWCRTAAAWIRTLHEQWGQQLFVIPDIRFPNEVDLVHELGGRVVRIAAPQRAEHNPLTPEQRQHASEIALDHYTCRAGEFDAVFPNDDVSHAEQAWLIDAWLEEWGWTHSNAVVA